MKVGLLRHLFGRTVLYHLHSDIFGSCQISACPLQSTVLIKSVLWIVLCYEYLKLCYDMYENLMSLSENFIISWNKDKKVFQINWKHTVPELPNFSYLIIQAWIDVSKYCTCIEFWSVIFLYAMHYSDIQSCCTLICVSLKLCLSFSKRQRVWYFKMGLTVGCSKSEDIRALEWLKLFISYKCKKDTKGVYCI